MNWFEKFCRDAGLMIHHIRHPHRREVHEVSRKVEEKQQGNITLRRTTIEEIEIKDDESK